MLTALAEALELELAGLEALHRNRACPPLSGNSRAAPGLAGAPVRSFCSNDYLGLATHPAVVSAAITALRDTGTGAASSRLVAGDHPQHRALEEALARYLRTEAALVFPTGYQANLGVLTSLAGPDDLIVSDAANHASLIDGCRLSRARVTVYPHLDVAAALRALGEGRYRRRFLVTESLFSMDGDAAPLAALGEGARAADAALIVDEAHAFGILGPGGRGLCAAAGVAPDVLIGTLGKALGSFGGFAAGSQTLRRHLVNRARTFIYTTALPPSSAAAARAALEIVSGPPGDDLRQALHARATQLRAALRRPTDIPSPIVPVVLGRDADALAVSRRLLERKLFVQAIRPPTVPEGTARLRLTVSAAHDPADVDALAAALSQPQEPLP